MAEEDNNRAWHDDFETEDDAAQRPVAAQLEKFLGFAQNHEKALRDLCCVISDDRAMALSPDPRGARVLSGLARSLDDAGGGEGGRYVGGQGRGDAAGAAWMFRGGDGGGGGGGGSKQQWGGSPSRGVATLRYAMAVRLDARPPERAPAFELCRTGERGLRKVLSVFAFVGDEIRELAQLADAHFLPALACFGERPADDERQHPAAGEGEEDLGRALPFLQELANFVERCQACALNLVQQLAALYSPLEESYVRRAALPQTSRGDAAAGTRIYSAKTPRLGRTKRDASGTPRRSATSDCRPPSRTSRTCYECSAPSTAPSPRRKISRRPGTPTSVSYDACASTRPRGTSTSPNWPSSSGSLPI